jgi:hypothetical protein
MDPKAPYAVTGFKGGYLTWNGAVKAARARGATVTDKDGNQIYPPLPSSRQLRVRAIVAALRCPQCGGGIKRNNTISGWWQCEQFGAETHRKDPSRPACSWQDFV